MSRTATATARHPRITSDPNVMLGKPCIKGTRITVELILRWLSEGRSFAELQEAYPHISEDDIKAALAYAANRMGTGGCRFESKSSEWQRSFPETRKT